LQILEKLHKPAAQLIGGLGSNWRSFADQLRDQHSEAPIKNSQRISLKFIGFKGGGRSAFMHGKTK
jgi:hypothetical protein